MAVQAHHSSPNILLPLINRSTLQQQAGTTTTIQIGNNYSQPGLIAPNTHLNNNFPVGNSSRKRGREEEEDNNMMKNQFIPNVRQKQSQIESRNNTVDVSTGLRLAFNDHHQQLHYSINHQPYDLSNLINQQADEIERYLHAQGEELRRTLAERRHRHYSALIEAAKDSAKRMIREKEAVVNKAARRQAELEAQASRLSAEAEVWQARARAQEAVAVALHAQLQNCEGEGEVGAAREAEDAESSYVDPERVVVVGSGPGCKACGKRVASVVLLPCRHLCVCSECDDVVQTCPLCLSFRSSSVEVYMS